MLFTHMIKNESLGIILLMEQQFNKLIQKTKVQNEQKDPLFKSFEGALFKDSAWFFHFQDKEIPVVQNTNIANTMNIPNEIIEPPIASTISLNHTSNDNYLSEVLFIGDNYSGSGDDLLGKMIIAMKLSGEEVNRFPMDEELEQVSDLAENLLNPNTATKNLLNIISKKQPRVVVSLGATVTNILLGKREKLSTIHGQFIEKRVDECVYSLMPLFHPDFLVINPNMKRTAWADLQKLMERIGKI
jgi:uracil-DNA glycosylase family 4